MADSNGPGEGELKAFYERTMAHVRDNVPGETKVSDLAMFYKVFGDATRLKILFALSYTELRVCDICEALSLKQSTVSQQMRILRQMRLVKSRHDGKNIYYSPDDDHIAKILFMGLEHIEEKK